MRMATPTRTAEHGQPQAARAVEAPKVGGPVGGLQAAMLSLQRTVGNRAVGRLLGAPPPSPPMVGGIAPAEIASSQGPGQPLDEETRAFMEERFQYDLGAVRIHSGDLAGRASAALRATAYTMGNDIVFGRDRYVPHTTEGRRLLAHELAHVVQQTRAGAVSADPRGAEQEATAAAAQVDTPTPVIIRHSLPFGVQRAPEDEEPSYFRRAVNRVRESKLGERAADLARRGKAEAAELADKGSKQLAAVREELAATKDKVVAVAQDLSTAAAKAVREVRQGVSEGVRRAHERVTALKQEAVQKIQKAKTAAVALGGKAVATAKREASDRVLERIGEAKGVVLEATTLVDTVVYVGFQAQELSHRGLEAGLDLLRERELVSEQSKQLALDTLDVLSGRALSQAAVAAGLPTEAGAPSISGLVSEKLDDAVHVLERHLAPTPAAEVPLFTAYERGELKGAVETQIGLALIGVEEVQVALKILGAIGGVRGVVQTVQSNPSWEKDPAFWSSLLNLGLSVVGLSKAAIGKRIVQIALKSQAYVSAVPAVLKLYQTYTDPELAKDPEKHRKAVAQAMRGVVIAMKDVVVTIIHTGRAGKTEEAAGKRAPTTEPAAETEAAGRQPPVGEQSAAPRETAAPSEPTSSPEAAPKLAEVVPITQAAKPSGSPTQLRPGVRPVTDLAAARARRQAATGQTAEAQPQIKARPLPEEQVESVAAELPLAAGAEHQAARRRAGPTGIATAPGTVASVGGGKKGGTPPPGRAGATRTGGGAGAGGGRANPPATGSAPGGRTTGQKRGSRPVASDELRRQEALEELTPEERRRVEIVEAFHEADPLGRPRLVPEGTRDVGETTRPRTRRVRPSTALGAEFEHETGQAIPPGHDRHHIVPNKGGGELGDRLREILDEVGIPNNSRPNAIPLPSTTLDPRTRPEALTRHAVVHTERNLQAILDELEPVAGDRDLVRAKLQKIEILLREGKFPH